MKIRKSNRLKHYNYSENGYYYITTCTKDKMPYFGDVKDEKMVLNQNGNVAQYYWQEIPNHYENLQLDEYIIMPNHLHGIIIISNSKRTERGTEQRTERMTGQRTERMTEQRTERCSVPTSENICTVKIAGLLSTVVRTYKTFVTRVLRNKFQIPEFSWQRSFYDHIIRDENSLNKIREYIITNPLRWDLKNKNIENLYL